MMEKLRVIKTSEEYQKALHEIDILVKKGELASKELEQLELLSILVEDYEKKTMPIDLPDPIEAIKFRMEQDGLSRKDLQKYIGSASKVSEILNRKVGLSLKMIRALHEGLGIPAEVLMQEPGKSLPPNVYAMNEYPFNEMFKNGYFTDFTGTLLEAKEHAEELLTAFFGDFTIGNQIYCKKTDKRSFDPNALYAWRCQVCRRVSSVSISAYDKNQLTDDFFSSVARLSFFDYGPQVVAKHLNQFGIHLVFEKHLPKTYLDGAAFVLPDGHPVVAMTLRHDRIDNFWFTLLHELAHIKFHLSDTKTSYFDDIADQQRGAVDDAEQTADKTAEEALIPNEIWKKEKDRLLTTKNIRVLEDFSRRHKVALPVVIGKIHWETQKFKIFSRYLGNIREFIIRES